jgi:hypothetical protein
VVENNISHNKDYAKSAVKLTNPESVKKLYAEYKFHQQNLADIDLQIATLVPDSLKVKREAGEQALAEAEKTLKAMIETDGSYQDVTTGEYALLQNRVSVSYSVDGCRKAIPDFAKAVITETVDQDKIKGLLKGKLITEDQVKPFRIETPASPAFIIK